MVDLPKIFGSMVFNDEAMKLSLPEETYNIFKKTVAEEKSLDPEVANVIACAMKEWAIEKGATHYTHWFQPMTGITAEKHDSFISPDKNGRAIMEFSGKELVKGEPDASSFPSGGLRATFEARGYTAWDPSSYAFIKNRTLCIPTAFCSYSGDALDKKTPLLRSMEEINRQTLRLLRALGDNETEKIITTVGPEQEYFLIDKSVYDKRPDLIYTGRTLFGAKPPKGQEMDDHYFGSLKERVSDYMFELDEELWKLGVFAKTEHNEAAPGQHELAPVYTTTNIAVDHNQLTMALMKSVAAHHGLACLLHEKPFNGVNGSGKHNNWSLCTEKGVNLLDPGKKPSQNLQFLLILTAVMRAVDENQDLLRISVASPGNDHRLGANEAPPAIVSMFLGSELTDIFNAIENEQLYTDRKKNVMQVGAHVLPHFTQDTADRNRTSPFAFTGNKFEFRMLGSNLSVAGPNIVLNTIVADIFEKYAIELEKDGSHNSVVNLIKKDYSAHKRIVFNGNNYAPEWTVEAERRGLLNLRNTVDCLPLFLDEKNINLFVSHGVFSESEMKSRYEILVDNYIKTINIEALTFIDMVNKGVLPSGFAYQTSLAKLAEKKSRLNVSNEIEMKLLSKISDLCAFVYVKTETLKNSITEVKSGDLLETAKFYSKNIVSEMESLRADVDELEANVSKECWCYPTYSEMIYSVR